MLSPFDRHELPALRDPVNRQHPQTSGLLVWYLVLPGMDGGRFWYDLMGLSPGTLTNFGNSTGWRRTVRPGGFGRILFSGAGENDYVDCGSPASILDFGTGAFSVCLWRAGPNANAANRYALSKYNTNGWGVLQTADVWAGTTGKSIGFLVTDASGNNARAYHTTAAVDDGGWHHVVCTADGTNIHIYIDGADAALTTDRNAGSWPNVTNSTSLNIGRYGGGSNYDAASMDDVRIYNRALSAAEVWAIYENSRVGYPDLLNRVGRWVLVPPPFSAGMTRSNHMVSGGYAS